MQGTNVLIGLAPGDLRSFLSGYLRCRMQTASIGALPEPPGPPLFAPHALAS